MALINIRDVIKSFGPDVVFSGLNLQLYGGQKVGMVGPNGSGKTTILKLILGSVDPDVGEVVKRKGLRVGYLPQEPMFDGDRSVIEQMHMGVENLLEMQTRIHLIAERMEELSGELLKKVMGEYESLCRQFETAGGYAFETKIKSILNSVGLGEELAEVKVSALSGGQLSRLGLAAALVNDTDMLLLDEPTNHLDLQATEWLEGFLRNYDGAAVVISHDRYLLDRVAEKIIEVSGGRAKVYKGNYSNYVSTKEKAALAERRGYEKRREMVEKTRDFIARNKDQEGMRGTARGRKKRLERLLTSEPDFLEKPKEDKKIDFAFGKGRSRSELVVRSEGLCKQFGDLKLFEGLSFDVLSGERLGITGPNGTGKSTLLKMAMGQVEPTGGEIKIGQTVTVGYLDQHGRELDENNTVLEEAQGARPDMTPESVRGLLGAFGFSGDDVFKRTGDLSGGQQNRLMLCKLVLSGPDVLVLDEPTNHLDIASREALEEALCKYNGTVIVISHDRFFLDKAAGRLLLIGVDGVGGKKMGRFEFFEGSGEGRGVYSLYTEKVRERAVEIEENKEKNQKKVKLKGEKAGRVEPELREFNKFSTEQIEEMVIELEEKIVRMQEKFGDEEMYRTPELLKRHKEEFEVAKDRLELLLRAYEAKG